jgi:hypothetical protein
MMDDRDLEARLREYRPVGPPPELLVRLADARADSRRAKAGALAWLPAVAALLLTALFYWLADDQRRMLSTLIPPAPTIDQAVTTSSDREELRP